MLNLHQLRIFCEVVREGSVTRAAANLFITQPSVTIQVRRLERTLGVRLVERLHGRLVPTGPGELLHASAMQMLELEAQARATLEEMRTGEAGRVRIGTGTGALYYIKEALARFRDDYPRAELVLTVAMSDEIAGALAENMLDLGMVWLPIPKTKVVAEPVARTRYRLVVSPRHALASRSPVSAGMLSGQRFITAQRGSASYTLFADELLRKVGVQPAGVMEFNHTEPIKQAAEANLGIGIVPERATEGEVREGRLVEVEIRGASLSRQLALAYRPQKIREPLVAGVVQQIRTELARDTAG